MIRDTIAPVLGTAVVVAAATLVATACGGSRRPNLAAQRRVADDLIAEGCYRCLDEAVVRYAGLPPARDAVARVNDAQLFRALILLALREKELGLEAAARHLHQAMLLAPHTPAPAVAREQLKWAELIPSNPSGLPRDAADDERARLAAARGDLERRVAGATAVSDPLDVYLNVSLACSASFPLKADPDALAAPAAAHPIVQWRLAICGRRHEDALRAFAEAHPRYVEADYWRGRYRSTMAASTISGRTAVSLVSDPAVRREVRDRLRAALTAIPDALAIAFDLAGQISVSSPRDALPLYEQVANAQPRHNEAWLGQGICLTYLDRPRDAVDALSRVVDLGRWSVGDALYWRAWNRLVLGELETAWVDVEQARTTLYNTNVYGLAGRIAFERKAFDTARPLLEKAVELSETNCSAAWFLGLLHSTQERWLAGGAAFEAAEACYRGDIARARDEGQRAAADAADDAARAERQAQTDASIRTAERQAALSAYNAAFNLVRGGEPARSRPLLDRALQHPEVSDRARELRAFVDR